MHSVSSQWVSRMLHEKILELYAAFFATAYLPLVKLKSSLAYTDNFVSLLYLWPQLSLLAWRSSAIFHDIRTRAKICCLSLIQARRFLCTSKSSCLNRRATQTNFDFLTKLKQTQPQCTVGLPNQSNLCTNRPWPAFVLEVPPRNLRLSMHVWSCTMWPDRAKGLLFNSPYLLHTVETRRQWKCGLLHPEGMRGTVISDVKFYFI